MIEVLAKSNLKSFVRLWLGREMRQPRMCEICRCGFKLDRAKMNHSANPDQTADKDHGLELMNR
jgi:hypothetical protein